MAGIGSTAETTLYRYDGGTNFQELEDADGAGSGTAFAVFTELVRAGGMGGGIGSVLYSDKSNSPLPIAGPADRVEA